MEGKKFGNRVFFIQVNKNEVSQLEVEARNIQT